MPVVRVGKPGMLLAAGVEPTRTVVDLHVHLPDMFELTFVDEALDVADRAGLKIGVRVEIAVTGHAVPLIVGEVTAVEAACVRNVALTIVRGYEAAHRLQRAKHSRTFVGITDADIARSVANDARLEIGDIDETGATHAQIAQVAQTDWEFLKFRAREIGFETGVTQGKFYFRRPAGSASPAARLGGLGAHRAAASSAAGAVTRLIGAASAMPQLKFRDNLISFFPRVTAANLTPTVEVRTWDPKSAEVRVARARTRTGSANVNGGRPAALGDDFAGRSFARPTRPPVTGRQFGPEPDPKAYVVVDRPIASGPSASRALDNVAEGVADHIGSPFAEAEGLALGDVHILAGHEVKITGVPRHFDGTWVVTRAQHVFDLSDGGYNTRFFVEGRQDRSLFGLASGGTSQGATPRIEGLVCGIVSDISDTDKLGRVKVALPWLSQGFVTDWAPVVQFGAGQRSGAVFLPEVGDQVLLGFEFGDPRRPYVLGGVANDQSKNALLNGAVERTGMAGAVVKRGFVTPSGNALLFVDKVQPPPSQAPPMTSSITLGTKNNNLALAIDQVAGTVTLTCDPKPPDSKSAAGNLTISVGNAGNLTIETGQGGTLNVKAGQGGTLNIDGGLALNLKAAGSIKMESQGAVEIKGAVVKLN
jgi:phage protein D